MSVGFLMLSLLCGCGGGGEGLAPIVVTTGASSTTSESGTQITVMVVLSERPTSPVMIPVSSSDATEGSISLTSVTFTTENWNAPRTVTVTGVNDSLTDGDQTFHLTFGPSVSMDANFAGVTVESSSLTNSDNDSPGITVSAASGATHESGGNATFTVVLTSGPSSDVVIGLSSSDPGEGTPTVSSLTFTAENWNAPQTVTVLGVNDDDMDGEQLYTIELTAPTSSDPLYAALPAPADVAMSNLDNDSPSIVVSAASGPTTEAGGTAMFSVRLGSPPIGSVIVHFDTNDATEGTVTTTALTFTTQTWSTTQSVTVTGVNDFLADGNQPYAIVFTAQTGTDAAYTALAPPSNVALVNNDNDVPGISIVAPPAGGLLRRTSEFGWKATFTVALLTQPTSPVTVNFDTNSPDEGTPNVTSLMFTDTTPQTVTVTGQDDPDIDGRQDYAIVFTALTGSDSSYTNLTPPANLTFVNCDDETPFRVRTEYIPGGAYFYVAVGRLGSGGTGASSTHAVATPLSDSTLIANDFLFYVRKGLSDPTPSTPPKVSFESVSSPGSYLRFDSVTPTRWPMCSEVSTQSPQLCIWDFNNPVDRQYLIWVEPFVDNATYRGDATFTVEGTPALSNFRSVLQPTRLLRHASYQMVAWTWPPGNPNHENEFVLEQ